MSTLLDTFLFTATTGTFILYNWRTKRKQESDDKESNLLRTLQDGTSRDARERICSVNQDNEPTLTGHYRSEMRLNNLWHRATYILVLKDANSQSNGRSLSTSSSQQVFVQRRSLQKDYCPGKLDPTPGGVVGFGESYQENAEREVFEEMGIDVMDGNALQNSMDRLFTFSYSDEKVKVWGGFFEVRYHGSIDDLTIQEEEVEDVFCMSLDELKARIEESPDDFMPDACHAMKLYFQRKGDMLVNRRLLKGYSSGNLDKYKLRPKPKVCNFHE
jgi:8-oxo-dGTP pyrophosphatase MutT (NUDIX family)